VLHANDGGFRLRVVAGPGFSAPEEAALVKAFLLRVPAIPRGPNGKFEFVALEG
jgi:phenylacetate-CoA ligase